jgi:Sigma 54 modulation protein / S30EA ribosomal protein
MLTVRCSCAALQAAVQDGGRKPVLITGNNIEVTPALHDYVNKKVDKILEKLGGVVTKVCSIYFQFASANESASTLQSRLACAMSSWVASVVALQ